MGTDLAQLQSILGYQFTNYDKLELALTAAGADEKNHDGNRGMAQMGEKLIGLLLAEIVYEAGGSKGELCVFFVVYRFTNASKLRLIRRLLLLLQKSIMRTWPRLQESHRS